MKDNWDHPIGSASLAPIKIIYRGVDLSEEIKAVPTQDPATKLTLEALSEDLIAVEGLDNSQDEGAGEHLGEDLILIPWDDSGDE